MMQRSTAPIEARMVAYRVLVVDSIHVDRPMEQNWDARVVVRPATNDVVELSIGEVPEDVTRAIRATRAWGRLTFHQQFVDGDDQLSLDDTDSLLGEFMTAAPSGDPFSLDNRTALTLTVSRPLTVTGYDDLAHNWVDDPTAVGELAAFADLASEILDGAGVGLLSGLPEAFETTRTLYRNRMAFLTAVGKTPRASVRVTVKETGFDIGLGWSDLDRPWVEQSIAALTSGQRQKLTKTAGRWLWAALAEEDDALRRFMFAFFGLEVLANKAGSHFERTVASAISTELGLPVEPLFWPSTIRDSDSPNRNLAFRFALLAIHLNRDGSADDIALFKDLATARNQLAHGQGDDLQSLPGNAAVSLLRTYLRLMADVDLT